MVFTETILSHPWKFCHREKMFKIFRKFYFSRAAYYNFDLKRKITKKIISNIFKKIRSWPVMTIYIFWCHFWDRSHESCQDSGAHFSKSGRENICPLLKLWLEIYDTATHTIIQIKSSWFNIHLLISSKQA